MAVVIQSIVQSYYKLVDEDPYADPRVKDFFLVSRPLTVFAIVISYIYFCKKLGPQMMKGRKPYELKTVILVYNVLQILANLYITTVGAYLYYKYYNWACQPMDHADTPLNKTVHLLCKTYYLLKLAEFLDTVFFVLRKKYNQVSTLHLFHHTLMFFGSWIGMRYLNTGHGIIFALLNSFVHVVMYSYYLVAGLGPQYQKYLWWKKYLTILQLVQFVVVFFHNLIPFFDSSCTYPKFVHVLEMFFASTFIYLFGNFYMKTYVLKNNSRRKNE